jgi:Resolvase, N terminal domain
LVLRLPHAEKISAVAFCCGGPGLAHQLACFIRATVARNPSKPAAAAFRSLGDPLFDTTSSQGRLLLAVLAAIASFERDLIRERTTEGRRRAMAEGKRFGRKPKLTDFQRKEALKRRAAGETLAEIAKSYAVDISMISRLAPGFRSPFEGTQAREARQGLIGGCRLLPLRNSPRAFPA